MVTLRRTLIHALDKPGGRRLLGALATRYARTLVPEQISIFYDDVWIRNFANRVFLPDSFSFPYYREHIIATRDQLNKALAESRDCWFHLYQPRTGDVIVDIGAGAGLDPLVFSEAIGPSGRVIAVEAHPKAFLLLQKLCKWNRLTNVVSIQRAIVDSRRTVHIEDLPEMEKNSLLLSEGGASVDLSIEGVSLDELCAQLGVNAVTFLKMNIEGAERTALAGMKDIISRTRYVCIACHDFRADRGEGDEFRTRDVVIDFLIKHDFDIVTRDADPRPYVRDHIHGLRRGI